MNTIHSIRRLCAIAALAALPWAATPAHAREGDFVMRRFRFHSGETLPELRIHYLTLGQPRRDTHGRTSNAVLILHGTGGTGRQFMSPQFAGVLYGRARRSTRRAGS